MLVITKHLRQYCRRPKYHPAKLWQMWCVTDSETEKRVFGPDTLIACNRYISESVSGSAGAGALASTC